MKLPVIVGIGCAVAALAYVGVVRRPKTEKSVLAALPPGSRTPTPNSPYLRVFVTKGGSLFLEGKQASLPELSNALDQLAAKRGVVLYSRESPEESVMHPIAKSILDAAIEKKLPILLCLNADFSDVLGPDGKLKLAH